MEKVKCIGCGNTIKRSLGVIVESAIWERKNEAPPGGFLCKPCQKRFGEEKDGNLST